MLTPMPESPLAAKKTTPGCVMYWSKVLSCEISASPKLILTTPPPFCATNCAAYCTACQLGSVLHCGVVHNVDTTRNSLACGAMACDHLISSASSVSHSE